MSAASSTHLILSRKAGESVVIHNPQTCSIVEIDVARVRGDRVKLAVRAPSDTIVDRDEVFERRINTVPNERTLNDVDNSYNALIAAGVDCGVVGGSFPSVTLSPLQVERLLEMLSD